MKLPEHPPAWRAILSRDFASSPNLETVLDDSKYLHWDDLRRRKPPEGLNHPSWWARLKLQRFGSRTPIALRDTAGRPFTYSTPDTVLRLLHAVSLQVGGSIQVPDQVLNDGTRDRYFIRSLIEEAITSSQLEGATTTRPVAKEMLRSGRRPRDRSERMILNNYLTMKFIAEDARNQPLTPDLLLHIHELVTRETLDDPSHCGRLRCADDNAVRVESKDDGTVLHIPPDWTELPTRLTAMCDFANSSDDKGRFIHPALRAIILHFWLAFDHPFVDGNGRTARAIFYWCMLRHRMWLAEFLSISEILVKAPAKYARSFLHTETDENDLTYFVLYQLEVLERSMDALKEHVHRKARELRQVDTKLRDHPELNVRQRILLAHALRHPNHDYTVASHRESNGVVYETARSDLHGLRELGLLEAERIGKTWHFRPAPDLADKIEARRKATR